MSQKIIIFSGLFVFVLIGYNQYAISHKRNVEDDSQFISSDRYHNFSVPENASAHAHSSAKQQPVSVNKEGVDYYLAKFKPNNSVIKDELDAMKKLSNMTVHDLESNFYQMNSAMRYHSERIISGDPEDKLESISIFELAASDNLKLGVGDRKYLPANKDLLLQQYPEYSSQISQAFEIRECFLKRFDFRIFKNGNKAEEISVAPYTDYSFFTSIYNYYKNDQHTNFNNDVTAQVLNFYTSQTFRDKTLSWWLNDFESNDLSKLFIGRKSFYSLYGDDSSGNVVEPNITNE